MQIRFSTNYWQRHVDIFWSEDEGRVEICARKLKFNLLASKAGFFEKFSRDARRKTQDPRMRTGHKFTDNLRKYIRLL